MTDTLQTDPATESVTLSKSCHAVCLEAAWEIDALALALPDLVPIQVGTEDGAGLVVRGVAARLSQLANALQATLFDEVVTVRELQKRVTLELD